MDEAADLLQPPRLHTRAPGHDGSLNGNPVRSSPDRLNMRNLILTFFAVLQLTLAAGCVYVAPVSQGNLLDQDDVDQVEVGMTRNQVRFLLGTPMIDDPFHIDRWDYVYYLKIGRKDATFKRWLSIHFENDRVTDIVSEQELSPNL